VDLVLAWEPFPEEIPRTKFTVALRSFTADEDDLCALDFKLDMQT
jgi:hypothetical protein